MSDEPIVRPLQVGDKCVILHECDERNIGKIVILVKRLYTCELCVGRENTCGNFFDVDGSGLYPDLIEKEGGCPEAKKFNLRVPSKWMRRIGDDLADTPKEIKRELENA